MAKKKPSSGVVQPTVRTFTTWTPSLIRAVEANADSGSFRLLANLVDWLFGDDRIKACMDARVQALFGLDPTFEKAGDKRRSARIVRALEADQDWWDSYPEAENSLIVAWGIVLGFSVGSHNWEQGGDTHGGRLLAKPEFWHPQNVRYDNVNRKWMTWVASETSVVATSEVEIVPGDGQWILHLPYGKSRPWAQGIWRGLARLALIKAYAQSDWARLGETASRAVVTIDKDTKASSEQRRDLAAAINQLGRDGVIVLPSGFDFKLIETSASTQLIYDAQIKMADEAIAVLIRGGNLSTIVKGGSRAASQTQKETGDDAKLRFDAQAFTTTIHDQSLNWWALLNFGDAALAPWPVYPVEQEEDLVSKATTMDTAADGLTKLVTLGFEVDQKAFTEEFALAGFLKPGPKALAAPAPVQPAATPAAPTGGTPPAGAPAKVPTGPQNGVAQVMAQAATGVENGQTYADDVFDSIAKQGSRELAATIAGMIAAVHSADGYDAAKTAIVAKYKKLASPKDLATLTEAAINMVQLGGNLSVREDIPDLEEE